MQFPLVRRAIQIESNALWQIARETGHSRFALKTARPDDPSAPPSAPACGPLREGM
jgi:hypothetical protein